MWEIVRGELWGLNGESLESLGVHIAGMEDILPGLGVIFDDPLLHEAVLFGSHHKIMGQILDSNEVDI